MNKRILITGGDGFIAKHLISHLDGNYVLCAPTKQQLDLTIEDEVDKFIDDFKPDIIIHTSNYDAVPSFTNKDPDKVLDVNMSMFRNLVKHHHKVEKVIYFGSGSENPLGNDYEYSKSLMNSYALYSNNIYNLRLYGVYGEHDDWRYRYISNWCCKIAMGKNPLLKQNQLVSMIYVKDLVKIVNWMINANPKHKTYNVGSKAYNLEELARKLISVSCVPLLNLEIENKEYKKAYYSEDDAIFKESGIIKTPLDESLKNMYLHYKWLYDSTDKIKENELLY